MSQLRIKQGATFALTLIFTDATGAPINLAAAVLAAKLRTATGTVVEQLAITATGVPGQATVLSTTTNTWPVGLLRSDISASGSGLTTISDTFMVAVEQAITQ